MSKPGSAGSHVTCQKPGSAGSHVKNPGGPGHMSNVIHILYRAQY